jgi:4,5-dihydroxyphthalate decarboxylase
MHCLDVRKDLANDHPWLPKALLDGFTKAKSMALAELSSQGSPKVALPWLEWYQSLTRQLLGDDYWPYGLRANYNELQAMLRYARQDGLAKSLLKPEDLFHPSTWGD